MFKSIRRAALRMGLLAGLLGVPLAMVPVGTALADPSACDVTYTGTVSGTVVVPSGTNACFNGAHVTGSVIIQPGGSADIEDSTISGAVTSSGAKPPKDASTALTICNSTLGSLTVTNSQGNVLVGDGMDTECLGNAIQGAATFSNNHYSVNAAGNTVKTSLIVTGNNGEEVDLAANSAGGSIVCTGNDAPFDYPYEGPNSAKGAIVGQCTNALLLQRPFETGGLN